MAKVTIIKADNLELLKHQLQEDMAQSHRYVNMMERETHDHHVASGRDLSVRTDVDEKIALENRSLAMLRTTLCYIEKYSSEIEI